MEETLQICSFLLSFCYGVFFGLATIWHFHVTNHYSILMKYLTTFLFILDIVLGYLFCMYQLNEGVFHVYFLLFVLIGFGLAFPLQKYVKSYFQKQGHLPFFKKL